MSEIGNISLKMNLLTLFNKFENKHEQILTDKQKFIILTIVQQ